jgi:hypothetical protein
MDRYFKTTAASCRLAVSFSQFLDATHWYCFIAFVEGPERRSAQDEQTANSLVKFHLVNVQETIPVAV